jgi:orotate phosphoribosyltransferase
MKEFEKHIAQQLLQINAIKLNPAKPFIWASGWNSPIYCDNRKTLSFPEVRKSIRDCFVSMIRKKYPEAEGIAGVATGAIAHGALVAEAMDLPFIYVRSAAKGHGLENLIEGYYTPKQRFVVVEDLISTGGSSLRAVEALRSSGCEVLGMVAIFTYGFGTAVDNFLRAGCLIDTLSNYETLLEIASDSGYINKDQIATLQEWRKAPETWKK